MEITIPQVEVQNEELLQLFVQTRQAQDVDGRKQTYTQVRYMYLSMISFFFKMLYLIMVAILGMALFAGGGGGGAAQRMTFVVKIAIIGFFIVVYPFLIVFVFDRLTNLVARFFTATDDKYTAASFM